jgi:hypothetical protein
VVTFGTDVFIVVTIVSLDSSTVNTLETHVIIVDIWEVTKWAIFISFVTTGFTSSVTNSTGHGFSMWISSGWARRVTTFLE